MSRLFCDDSCLLCHTPNKNRSQYEEQKRNAAEWTGEDQIADDSEQGNHTDRSSEMPASVRFRTCHKNDGKPNRQPDDGPDETQSLAK